MGSTSISRRFALIAVVSYFVFQEAAGKGLFRATSQQSLWQLQRNNPFFPNQRRPTTTARPIARRRFPLNTGPVPTTAKPSLRRPQFPDNIKPGEGMEFLPYIGSPAPIRSYRFAVYLEFDYEEFEEIGVCAGTLLSEEWVLTATHCVISFAPTKILLGTNTRIRPFPESVQERTMQRKCCHKGYDAFTLEHDICLIKLSSPVEIDGTFIQRARLPDANSIVPDGTTVIGMGWGEKKDGKLADKLQYGEVQVVNKQQCIDWYADDGRTIPHNHLCAGDNKTDSCFGDSGGPLVTEESNGEFVLRGLASFGPPKRCAVDKRPGVYTAVGSYVTWINEKMSRPCNEENSWTSWTSMGCSVTCGTGTERSTRECRDDPGTLPLGCPGRTSKDEACTRHPCKEFTWTPWRKMGCSVTCGIGAEQSNRECQEQDGTPALASNCPGSATKTESCTRLTCKKYHWSDWKKTCAVTCGNGFEERTRNCMDERNNVVSSSLCPPGSAKTSGVCHRKPCPRTVSLTSTNSWGSWNKTCSVTCGTGTETKIRKCQNKHRMEVLPSLCSPGDAVEYGPCTMPPCSTGKSYRWGSWTTKCSVTCGIGLETKTRKCLDQGGMEVSSSFCSPGGDTEYSSCSKSSCKSHVWGPWKVTCSVTCGMGTETKTRKCLDQDGVQVLSSVCSPGDDTEVKSCERSPCIALSKFSWGPWTKYCTVTCGDGTEINFRRCLNDQGLSVNPSHCQPGSQFHRRICSLPPCGNKYRWGPWKTTCSVTCGRGSELKSRQCLASNGQPVSPKKCQGISNTRGLCAMVACKVAPKYKWGQWWKSCSVTCGTGIESNFRQCLDGQGLAVTSSHCHPGSEFERRTCSLAPCVKQYIWSPWKVSCSVTCGQGSEMKTRQCTRQDNGQPVSSNYCRGSWIQRGICTRPPCQGSGSFYWGQWRSWSICRVRSSASNSCDGFRSTTRDCLNFGRDVAPYRCTSTTGGDYYKEESCKPSWC